MKRWLVWLMGGALMFCVARGDLDAGGLQKPLSNPGPVSGAPQTDFLNTYCIGCHNQKIKSGGLVLGGIALDDTTANAAVMETVVRKLRSRAMPPAGRPRPDENAYESFISEIETVLDHAAEAAPNPGRIETFRRLSRAEYQNAIRDLLDLDVDVSSLLPKDDVSYGFDNVNTDGLSPTLMERYLSAAMKISRLAVGGPIRSPGGDTVILPADLTQKDHFDGLPFGTRAGAIVRHYFPLDGEYDFQIRLTRDRNEQIEGLTELHELEALLDGNKIDRFTLRPNPRGPGQAQSDYYSEDKGDAGLRFRIPVKAGPRELTVTFVKRPSALLETERQPYEASFNLDRHPRTQPALHSVSITGPFNPLGAGDTPSRRRIFICRPDGGNAAGCATKIVSTLARRAYRRAVTEDDIKVPIGLFETANGEGGFEAGIEAALQAILSSPQFLFRIEKDPPNLHQGSYRISDVELASRLSFFLWSSIPDDQLLNLAISERLSDPIVLQQQVKRMLNDDRAEALVTNFAGQWLHLRNLAAVSPDPRQFPDFDDNLRQGFRRETELFFASVMKEDRNVSDLLTANYTFVNERVARHYGIPNVIGDRFRRVTLPPDTRRAGLLGHGSILTVTSYANRTSPVMRGKWILENILGTPVPEPPPNVPPLDENPDSSKVLSMRERMVKHRASPACASCHQLMDPVGLSMENFDAIGRWRSREAGSIVDASGGLPDGSTFEGVQGLRDALMGRSELFVDTLSEKLLTYALGRGLEYYDFPAVRKITRDAASNDYRFSSIVFGIVNSTPFRMRRSQ